MDNNANGNFDTYSKNSYKTNHVPDKYDLKEVEGIAKSLIQDILSAAYELKLVKQQIVEIKKKIKKYLSRSRKNKDITDAVKKLRYQLQDLEQQTEALKQKISFLCHELESAKQTLTQDKHSMKANAHKLENQSLNNPTAELKLMRAAEIAWAEVERLTQLITEINEVLAQGVENMDGKTEQSDKTLYLHNRIRFSEKQPQVSDIDHILDDFDAARSIPSRKQDFSTLTFTICTQEPPMLGSVSSSGLDACLQKIPTATPDRMEIHPTSYSEGLYMNDDYSGQNQVGYDPYDIVSGPKVTGPLSDGPIMTQSDFNGK